MSNTAPDPQGQNSNTPPDPHASGGTPGPAPTGPPTSSPPPPGQSPPAAQATPPDSGGFLGQLGGFFGHLGEEWRRSREFNRELKHAQATAQNTLQPSPPEAEESDDPGTSETLLRRERNKRIQMISEFTDIRETFDHKIKRWVASGACFVVPWLLVIFMTGDVGEYFAGQPFTMKDWKIASIFGITALLEVVVAVTTNAWGNTTHDLNATDVQSDKTKLRHRAKTQMAAWTVLSLVSGFALYMFLMQQVADNAAIATGALTVAQIAQGLHATVDYSIGPNMINVLLRVIGTLAIDPACVFAVHVTSKNLDQFLKQQAQVTTAINEIADAFDKQEEAAARAEMRQKENQRFLELKGKMDDVNAEMMGKMGGKMLEISDQMFQQMHLPPPRIVSADDEDEDGRAVRRLRRG